MIESSGPTPVIRSARIANDIVGEVWSYPVYRFTTEWAPDAVQDELSHVTTNVWMADINVPPAFVGTTPFPNAAGEVFS